MRETSGNLNAKHHNLDLNKDVRIFLLTVLIKMEFKERMCGDVYLRI
jgi:hypothetical protein